MPRKRKLRGSRKSAEENGRKAKNAPSKRKIQDPLASSYADEYQEDDLTNLLEKKPKSEKKENQFRISSNPTLGNSLADLGDGQFDNSLIKISSWNVNGLKNLLKRGEIFSYLKKSNPDIICFNQTKLIEKETQQDFNLIKINNDYYAYYNCSKEKLNYAGVGIATKVKPMNLKLEFGNSKHDNEGRMVTAEFEKFYLVSCYFPNTGQKLERLNYRIKEWDIDIKNYINELKEKKPTILCGDLNIACEDIDIHDPSTNKRSAGFTDEERESFSDILKTGWIDTFRHLNPSKVLYTYFSARSSTRTKNLGWRMDYFLINNDAINGVKESTADTDVVGSDHIPIELTIDLNEF